MDDIVIPRGNRIVVPTPPSIAKTEDVAVLRGHLHDCIFKNEIAGEEWEQTADKIYDELNDLTELNERNSKLLKGDRIRLLRAIKQEISNADWADCDPGKELLKSVEYKIRAIEHELVQSEADAENGDLR
jgi:hypothetical protein